MHENLGNLAGYLLEKPTPEELDVNGCFSRESCKKVDSMLLNDLSAKLKGFYMPEKPPRGTDPNNRWRTVSCMQKAIRFGDAEMAKFAASCAYDMNKWYLMRRLGVCAIEDVGVGNLYAMLAVLAAMSSKEWRETADERRLFCFLAEMLASGAKDRAACELCCLADFDKSLDKQAFGKMTSPALAAIIEAEENSIILRQTAAWLMAGTKRFGGDNMPVENDRPATPLFQLMVKRGMSRAMLYAAAKVASRVGDGLFVSLLLIDEWLQKTNRMTVKQQELPATPKVGKLLGAAYDMHTREGRVAIGKFKKENPLLVGPYLQHCLVENRDKQLWLGIFLAEGGVLNRRVIYHNLEKLYEETETAELGYAGLPQPLHAGFLAMLRANIGKLNECREKVLWAKAKAH
jgi:hypothetical protein